MQKSINLSFNGGVISPFISFRADLEKYAYACSEATNFYVTKEGAMATRPPFMFAEVVQDEEHVRMIPYSVSDQSFFNYMLIVTKDYIRFVNNGRYDLEADKTVTGGSNSTSVIVLTIPSHGYNIGDLLVVTDEDYEHAHTLEVNTVVDADTIWARSALPLKEFYDASMTTVARVVTEDLPEALSGADLDALTFYQQEEKLRFGNKDHRQVQVVRDENGDWQVDSVFYEYFATPPTGLAVTSAPVDSDDTSPSDAGAIYVVTRVNLDGVESHESASFYLLNSRNPGLVATNISISWNRMDSTDFYRVYRTLFVGKDAELNEGMQFGLLAEVKGTQFLEQNITPDFKIAPPLLKNPLEGGQVFHVEITDGGSGYSRYDSITSSLSSVNFYAKVITEQDTGKIVGAKIIRSGSGLTPSSTFNLNTSTGSGATFTVRTTPTVFNDPRTAVRYKGRHFFAGSINFPNRVVSTRPGEEINFHQSAVPTAADPIDVTLDDNKLTTIKHLLPMPTGLFLFSQAQVHQLRGAGNALLTAENPDADLITNTGIGDVAPLRVDREVMYLTRNSTSLNTLEPSNLPTFYVDNVLSLYASHYFTADNPVVAMTYCQSPHSVVWFLRKDGTLLSYTRNAAQNISAFCDHKTAGWVQTIQSLETPGYDALYAVVKRRIGDKYYNYIEYTGEGRTDGLEEQCFVDSALSNAKTAGDILVRFAKREDGNYDYFSTIGVGAGVIMRTPGYRWEFVASNVAKLVLGEPFDGAKFFYTYTIGNNVSTIGNLAHLEGMEVEGLADGQFINGVVEDGKFTLNDPASLICVGLPYRGHIVTLPLTFSDASVQDQAKKVGRLMLRLYRSKSVAIGEDMKNLYDVKEALPALGRPTEFLEDNLRINVGARYTPEGKVAVQKAGPYGVTILGALVEFDLGDT